MNASHVRFAWSLAVLAGCASSGMPSRPSETAAVVIVGPHVASGTRFSVRLSAAHDPSDTTRVGRFEGVTEQSLRSPQGALIVSAGATVRGDLVWSARRGRWTLGNATISSVVGPLALRASIESEAVRDGQPGQAAPDVDERPRAAEANARSAGALSSASNWAPARIAFDRDQRVDLVLTRAILGPGASVVSSR